MMLELLAIALLIILSVAISIFAVNRDRSNDELSKKLGSPVDAPFAVFSVAQAFDPDQAMIWETQAPALQCVATAGSKGISLLQMDCYYACSAQRYPEIYDGSSFRSWLLFLEQEQLIRLIGQRVFITAQGREFLAYRVVTEAMTATRYAA